MHTTALTPEALTLLPRLLAAAAATGTPVPDGLHAAAVNAIITGGTPVYSGNSGTDFPSWWSKYIDELASAGWEGVAPNKYSLINGIVCIVNTGEVPSVRWHMQNAAHSKMLHRINAALKKYAKDTSSAV